MLDCRHPRRETAVIIDLPETHLDLAAAREVMRHEGSTRKQLLDACHVLANYGDWSDVIMAREMRNMIWAQRGADLTRATAEMAEARQIHTIDAAFVRLNAPEIKAERRKSRLTIAAILIVTVSIGTFAAQAIETIWTNSNAEALAVAEYMRGM